MSSGYSSRNWECPFFTWDKRSEVHCEGGKVRLPEKEFSEYVGQYCASLPGWRECPLAQALNKYYERKEESNANEKQ